MCAGRKEQGILVTKYLCVCVKPRVSFAVLALLGENPGVYKVENFTIMSVHLRYGWIMEWCFSERLAGGRKMPSGEKTLKLYDL